jgi:hypothetical protein
MSFLSRITTRTLAKADDGSTTFYPFTRMWRGYTLEDQAEAERIRRALEVQLVALLLSIVLVGLLIGASWLPLVPVPFVAFYITWALTKTHRLNAREPG